MPSMAIAKHIMFLMRRAELLKKLRPNTLMRDNELVGLIIYTTHMETFCMKHFTLKVETHSEKKNMNTYMTITAIGLKSTFIEKVLVMISLN